MDLIAWVNGVFVPLKEARVSILDRGFLYGDGLFETCYGRGEKIFRLKEHLERLATGAESLHIPLPFTLEKIASLVEETLGKNNLEEAVIRLQLTRGEGPPGLIFPEETKSSLVIQVRPVSTLPGEYREQGIAVCTATQSPVSLTTSGQQVKSCNYLLNILTQNQARETGFFEALYLDANHSLTEGTVSNVFIVKNDCVITPPRGAQVLDGITRKVVIEICANEKIEYREEVVTLETALSADEMFITNSGIGILPVTRINYEELGQSQPGPLTLRIADGYCKTVDSELGTC